MQGEELEPARRKAEAAGVRDIFIDDLREEFTRDYVFPMFRRAHRPPRSPSLPIFLCGPAVAVAPSLERPRAHAQAGPT